MIKPTVLLVDDEERIVRSLRLLLRSRFEVIATTDPHEALTFVRTHRIHVAISDQRMPQMTGGELLAQVRELSPHTMRILLTGYSELDAVIASINDGEIFRFLTKPWDPTALQVTVAKAADISQALFASADDLERARLPKPAVAHPGILVLDTVPATAELVTRIVENELSSKAPVYFASTAEAAMEWLASSPLGVLVCDIRLAGRDVTGAIKMFKQAFPQLVTLVVTEHRDTGVLIDLINEGQVYRFLPKPASRTLLARNLAAACAYHHSLAAAPALVRSHEVEPVQRESDRNVVARLKGLFDRIRGRNAVADLRAAYESP